MACLVGVAAAVHVGEVEAADGAQGAGVGEEVADRGGAADLHAEGVGFPQEMGEVLGLLDAAFEEGVVEMVGLGRSVGGEVGEVQDEAGAEAPSLAFALAMLSHG